MLINLYNNTKRINSTKDVTSQASDPKTVSGTLVHIIDGPNYEPVSSFHANVTVKEEGTGEKSPTNPYTIVGFNKGVVSVCAEDLTQPVNTYTFDFGQTIYGGYFDNEGNLIVTHGMTILDGTENSWRESTSYNFRVTLADMKSGNYLSGVAEWLKTATDTTEPLTIRFGANNNIAYFCGIINNISGVSDLASWKSYLSNNPLKIVYELAEPITLSIISQNILTLPGVNNIFTNCGNISFTYYPMANITIVDAVLKDNCSLLSPIVRLKFDSKPSFNYMSFEYRYYWITDIISVTNDIWELHGQVDVLTTYRNHIFNTDAFVLFDSTPNTQLPDNRLAIKTDCEAFTSTAAMPWNFAGSTGYGGGTYLIAVTGIKDSFSWNDGAIYSNHDTRAGTGVYTIPFSSLDQIGFDVSDITSDIDSFYQQWFTDYGRHVALLNPTIASDFFEYIGNAVSGGMQLVADAFMYTLKFWKIIAENVFGGGNALQNIKACYWLPFDVPDTAVSSVSKPLSLGTYKDQITGLKRVNDPIITSVWIDVTIPWQFTDWRNVSCTEVMLYIPMIGCINIPSDVVKGNNTLQVRLSVNLYSGALSAEVRCDGASLGTYGANVSMPYLIGDSNANIASITNTITSAASQNYVGAAANALNSLNAMSTSVGGIGGGAGSGLTNTITCICRVHNTSQEPSALINTIGTPSHQLKRLSPSLGYVQCLNAQVRPLAAYGVPFATQQEIEMINNYLNTGVYLE